MNHIRTYTVQLLLTSNNPDFKIYTEYWNCDKSSNDKGYQLTFPLIYVTKENKAYKGFL